MNTSKFWFIILFTGGAAVFGKLVQDDGSVHTHRSELSLRKCYACTYVVATRTPTHVQRRIPISHIVNFRLRENHYLSDQVYCSFQSIQFSAVTFGTTDVHCTLLIVYPYSLPNFRPFLGSSHIFRAARPPTKFRKSSETARTPFAILHESSA